jgi:hypothetical protein
MPQLPIPGSDNGTWGNILNDFLLVAHNSDGTLQQGAISTAGGYILPSTGIPAIALDTNTQSIISNVASKYVKPPSGIPSTDMTSAVQTSLGLANTSVQLGGDIGGTTTDPIITKLQGTTVNAASPVNNQVLSYNSTSGAWVPATVTSTSVNDATTSAPGIIQLDGDLGGTATSPVVETIGGHTPVTESTTLGGDLSGTLPNPTLTNSTNVESIISNNSTVTNKAPLVSPAFTGTPTAPTATAGTNTTQIATTAFVETAVTDGVAQDATSSTPGLIQLDGDLGGGATSPIVESIQGIAISGTPNSGQSLVASSSSTAVWSSVAGTTDWINVKQAPYSAAGNGTTDDTAAINSALNAAKPSGVAFFPQGTYLISSTVAASAGVRVVVNGAQILTSNGALWQLWETISLGTPQWVNVKDLGAQGNNSHDDTAAIQAAINYAGTGRGGVEGFNNGGIVYFPKAPTLPRVRSI